MHMNKRRQNNMGGGGQRHNNRPRRFGGNGGRPGGGPDDAANVARTRRNAMQAREKYQNLARDAMSMGDRVLAENYLQHADHYYRVIQALPPEEVRQPYQQRSHQGAEVQNESGESTAAPENANEAAPEPTHHADALPSFITQPN